MHISHVLSPSVNWLFHRASYIWVWPNGQHNTTLLGFLVLCILSTVLMHSSGQFKRINEKVVHSGDISCGRLSSTAKQIHKLSSVLLQKLHPLLYGRTSSRLQHRGFPSSFSVSCNWLEYTPCSWLAGCLQASDREKIFADFDKQCVGLESNCTFKYCSLKRIKIVLKLKPRWCFLLQ